LAHIAAHYACTGPKVPLNLHDDGLEQQQLPKHLYESLAKHLQQHDADDDDDDCYQLLPSSIRTATFAGGCFWGIQLAYDREPGVLATCVGYTQGNDKCTYPTYSSVCAEETGHTEACLVAFDPDLTSYPRLAELLFDRIPDPTMLNRVGKDRGTQYRTGMYAHSDEQLFEAQVAFEKENRMWFGREVATEVKRAAPFWPAEEVHQLYLEKGGRFGRPQSSEKGSSDEIRCYG